MELKSFLDSNKSFKDEVVKLAFEAKKDNLPEEFYKHSVKSVVEKYSAHYSRTAKKVVNPDHVTALADVAAEMAKKVAFLDESTQMQSAPGQGVSYEEISRTVDEYFEKHPEKLQGNPAAELGESTYHDVEMENEVPNEIIDGDHPSEDSNINQPRATAY